MAEYSVLCEVATGKADLVAAAVAKSCNMNETDQEGNSCLHIAAAQGRNDIPSSATTAVPTAATLLHFLAQELSPQPPPFLRFAPPGTRLFINEQIFLKNKFSKLLPI
jgi:hypothetical protein